jgi:hypothetical protein
MPMPMCPKLIKKHHELHVNTKIKNKNIHASIILLKTPYLKKMKIHIKISCKANVGSSVRMSIKCKIHIMVVYDCKFTSSEK